MVCSNTEQNMYLKGMGPYSSRKFEAGFELVSLVLAHQPTCTFNKRIKFIYSIAHISVILLPERWNVKSAHPKTRFTLSKQTPNPSGSTECSDVVYLKNLIIVNGLGQLETNIFLYTMSAGIQTHDLRNMSLLL